MRICDNCNAPLGSDAKLYSASEMRKAAAAGFRPADLGGAFELLGISADEHYATWLQLVQRDTTDWALCPSCVGKIEPYLKGS